MKGNFMMMKHGAQNAMVEALQRRKAKGLDLTILIGPHGEAEMPGGAESQKDDEKELGMAPDAEQIGKDMPEGQMDADSDKALIAQELEKAGLGKGSLMHKAMHRGAVMSKAHGPR